MQRTTADGSCRFTVPSCRLTADGSGGRQGQTATAAGRNACPTHGRDDGGRHGREAPVRAGLVLLTLALTCVLAAAQSGADWPTFRGKAQNTGVAHSPLSTNLSVRWTYETGSSVESTAAVVGDRVYVGTMTGALLALDLTTGRLRWKYLTGGNAISAAPLVQGTRVYVGDEGGTFHCVNAINGMKHWTFGTGGEIKSSAIYVDGSVLFGSYDSNLYRLDANTGRKLWQYTAEAQVHCTPTEAAGLVMIAGCDGFLRMIDLRTGQEKRSALLGGNFAGAPAYASGAVYVGSMDGRYWGVRLSDARILWERAEVSRSGAIYAAPAVMGDALIFASRSDTVFRANRATGEVEWTAHTRSDVNSSPVINGGQVLFGSSDGNIYRVGLNDGQKNWTYNTGSAISASPAIGQRRLVIGTEGGTIYCFG